LRWVSGYENYTSTSSTSSQRHWMTRILFIFGIPEG
jgi:hypothetical protein